MNSLSKGKINEILENNNKSLKERQTSKQYTEMDISVQEVKIEIEACKKCKLKVSGDKKLDE